MGFDTETEGLNPHQNNLILYQIGDDDVQFVIDADDYPINKMKKVIESYKGTWILQNAQFDLQFLLAQDIHLNKIYDTMLVECILTGGLGDLQDITAITKELNYETAKRIAGRNVGLAALAKKYAFVFLNKDTREQILKKRFTSSIITYAAQDVQYLPIIRKKQLQAIDIFMSKYGIDGKVLDLEHNAVKVIAEMCYNGIKIDKERYNTEVISIVNDLLTTLEEKLDDIVLQIPALISYTIRQGNLFFKTRKTEINWTSPIQKLKIIQKVYPEIKDTKAETLRAVKTDLTDTLVQHNMITKLSTSFGESFLDNINNKTGRIHSSIWQILSTGRISSSSPNLLNIPSKGKLGSVIRSCFIPQDGYKIVGGDYSGFELRIIAEYSQDPLWVKTFNDGEDLHSILCAKTFGIELEEVNNKFPYNPTMSYRYVQKIVNFGLSYGMSKYKLSKTIDVSEEEAQEIINKFFFVVPAVKEFLNNLGKIGKTRGYIKIPNPYGRTRFFPKWFYLQENPDCKKKEYWLSEIERASKNTPIQGINATVIKLALIAVQKEINTYNYPVKILLSIYDEILTECAEDFADKWKDIMNKLMIQAGEVMIKTIPVIVDCKISDYWTK